MNAGLETQIQEPNIAKTRELRNNRMEGIDSIRAVCAVIVALGHLVIGIFFVAPSKFIHLISSIYGLSFNGPAAVIVFFLISGFCIHYPVASGRPMNLLAYYSRRYVRIGIPMIATLILFVKSGEIHTLTLDSVSNTVLWSLVAEIIYYTIYPVLLPLKAAWGWNILLITFFCISYGVILSHMNISLHKGYSDFGLLWTWIVGLPCWLAGCRLSESIVDMRRDGNMPIIDTRKIWAARSGIWLTSVFLIALNFHTPFRYPLTLNIFAIPVYYWLRLEILYYRTSTPWAWLESFGKASYSLYLIHPVVYCLVGRWTGGQSHGPIVWFLAMCGVCVGTSIFYFIVERPSHILAKKIRLV
jgi:peptidoglycan/LPS O-acetylase OafA/YrhL